MSFYIISSLGVWEAYISQIFSSDQELRRSLSPSMGLWYLWIHHLIFMLSLSCLSAVFPLPQTIVFQLSFSCLSVVSQLSLTSLSELSQHSLWAAVFKCDNILDAFLILYWHNFGAHSIIHPSAVLLYWFLFFDNLNSSQFLLKQKPAHKKHGFVLGQGNYWKQTYTLLIWDKIWRVQLYRDKRSGWSW